MHIKNGIAYAGEPEIQLKVSGVRPMKDYRLWVRFNTGEAKSFDFTPMLDKPAFAPLKDESVFREVYIDYGIPIWCDGDVDIAPEYLYENGILAESAS